MLSFVFESCLFGVGEIQLGCQVYDLELHNVLLIGERLRHLPQHIWSDLGHVLAVLSDQPQDAGPRHRHLQAVWEGVIPVDTALGERMRTSPGCCLSASPCA